MIGKRKTPGIPHISEHDLRHLFATTCTESGVDIPTVSRSPGHKEGGALAITGVNKEAALASGNIPSLPTRTAGIPALDAELGTDAFGSYLPFHAFASHRFKRNQNAASVTGWARAVQRIYSLNETNSSPVRVAAALAMVE